MKTSGEKLGEPELDVALSFFKKQTNKHTQGKESPEHL